MYRSVPQRLLEELGNSSRDPVLEKPIVTTLVEINLV